VTGADILRELSDLGLPVRLAPDGTLRLPREAERRPDLLADLRAHRAEVIAALSPAVGARVLSFEERRRRAEVRLAERSCSTCGFSWWRIDARGDADCYACALLTTGRALLCARCGGTEWDSDALGRKACAACARTTQVARAQGCHTEMRVGGPLGGEVMRTGGEG
jgi:hypothetical protein